MGRSVGTRVADGRAEIVALVERPRKSDGRQRVVAPMPESPIWRWTAYLVDGAERAELYDLHEGDAYDAVRQAWERFGVEPITIAAHMWPDGAHAHVTCLGDHGVAHLYVAVAPFEVET